MSGNIAAKLALQRQKKQSNNCLPPSASTASTSVSTQDDLYCSPGMRPSTADSFDRQFQSFVSSSFDGQLSPMLADIEQDEAFSNNDEKRESTPGRGLAMFQQRKPSNAVVDNRENASSPPNDVRLMPPPPPRTTPKEKDIEKEPDEPMENVMEDDMKLDTHEMMQEPEVSLPIVDASTLESAPDNDDDKENHPVSTETTINAMTPKTNNKSISILETPQQQSSKHMTYPSSNGNANMTEMLFDRHDAPQSMVTPSPHAAPRANQENLSKEDHHTEFPRIHDFGHDLEGYLLALQEFKDNHLMSDQDIFLFHLLIDQVNATMNAQILEMQAMMDLLDEIEEEQNDMMEMHRKFDNPAFRDKLAADQTNDKTM